MRRERQGGGRERPAPTTAVPAPGPVGDQGDPLAPADTGRDDLHGSVRIQRVQDNICVERVGVHMRNVMNTSLFNIVHTSAMYFFLWDIHWPTEAEDFNIGHLFKCVSYYRDSLMRDKINYFNSDCFLHSML